jgi:hypothetical protein
MTVDKYDVRVFVKGNTELHWFPEDGHFDVFENGIHVGDGIDTLDSVLANYGVGFKEVTND